MSRGVHHLAIHHVRVKELTFRDGDRCCWCATKLIRDPRRHTHHRYATIEHLVPFYDGGPDWVENMALACLRCNSRRDHSTPTDFLATLNKPPTRSRLQHLAAMFQRAADTMTTIGGYTVQAEYASREADLLRAHAESTWSDLAMHPALTGAPCPIATFSA